MLSKRLSAIEKLIFSPTAADIGTDHGYLAAALSRRGVRVIATDINPLPLEKARSFAESEGADIDLRLGNGLSPLKEGEAETIVIAGMGGETIAGILSACLWARGAGLKYILQPMSKAGELRAFLWRNGFRVENETVVDENGRLFPIIEAVPGESGPLSPASELAGAPSNDPLRQKYRAWVASVTEDALKGALSSKRPEDAARAAYLKAALNELRAD